MKTNGIEKEDANIKTKDMPDINEVAYHEAAHAVVDFLNQVRIRKVSIIPDNEEGSLGRKEGYLSYHKEFDFKSQSYKVIESEIDDHPINKIMNEIMCCFAGDISRYILKHQTDKDGSSFDYAFAYALASKNCGSREETEAFMNYLWYKTYNKLKNEINWFLVQVLANELLLKKEINGRQVRVFLSEKRKDYFLTSLKGTESND